MARPYGIDFTLSSGQSLSLAPYRYDGAGKIVAIGLGLAPGSLSGIRFEYDLASRLLEQFDAGGSSYQSYTYDTKGNRTSVTTNGSWVPMNFTANNHIMGEDYDDAGNQTTRSGSFYTYDALDMLETFDFPHETYLYTADDERISTLRWPAGSTNGNDPSQQHWYTVRDLDGKVLRLYRLDGPTTSTGSWAIERDYVHRDGVLFAYATPTTTGHIAVDHLGTPRVYTSATGGLLGVDHYWPFGEQINYNQNDTEKMRFTGHERDRRLGGQLLDLDYMHARFYNPQIGRFLSVDTFPGDPSEPQGWNRYAYVRNNPLNYTDPYGLFGVGSVGQEICYSLHICGAINETTTVTAPAYNSTTGVAGLNSLIRGGLFLSDLVQLGKMDTIYRDAFLMVAMPVGGPAKAVPSGLRGASGALRGLFANGTVRGRSLIAIRQILLEGGFKQLHSLRGRGYRFVNSLGEEVRLMRRGGGWDIRIQNSSRNYLDEFGDVAKNRAAAHDIGIINR